MKKEDIYPSRKGYLQTELEKLEKSTLSDKNKKDLKDFCTGLLSTGRTKEYRAGKVISQLYLICGLCRTNLRDAELLEIQETVVSINKLPRSEATRADYRRAIKQFFNWFHDQDPRLICDDISKREQTKRIYKYFSKEVTATYKKTRINPNDVLTDDDIRLIIDKGCKTDQEKAIIMTLHETGMRTSELLLTEIKSFNINDRGIGCLYVGDGKTGRRSVDVIKCVPYIQEHLKHHPTKNDPDSYLFYYQTQRGKIKEFNHRRLYDTVIKCGKRAGCMKKCNSHWYRHSRASLDAMDGTMSDFVKKKRMGWTDDSKMIANYSHLGVDEIRRAWMRANKIEDESTKKEEFVTCVCKRIVSGSLSYCPHCGRPMSMNVVTKERNLKDQITQMIPLMPEKTEQKEEFIEVFKFAMGLLNDPKQMQQFHEFISKGGEKMEV